MRNFNQTAHLSLSTSYSGEKDSLLLPLFPRVGSVIIGCLVTFRLSWNGTPRHFIRLFCTLHGELYARIFSRNDVFEPTAPLRKWLLPFGVTTEVMRGSMGGQQRGFFRDQKNCARLRSCRGCDPPMPSMLVSIAAAFFDSGAEYSGKKSENVPCSTKKRRESCLHVPHSS